MAGCGVGEVQGGLLSVGWDEWWVGCCWVGCVQLSVVWEPEWGVNCNRCGDRRIDALNEWWI